MIGQSKDVGFQIGVSKTVPFPVTQVWRFLTSQEGLALWLSEGARLVPEKGAHYGTTHGVAGEVRSFRELDRIRITWRPRDWDHDTTVQVAIRASGTKTLLRFHQEWLANAEERSRQRDHWQIVLTAVIAAIGGEE